MERFLSSLGRSFLLVFLSTILLPSLGAWLLGPMGGVAGALTAGVVCAIVLLSARRAAAERCHWYEQIIDSVHQPLSVTDLDMNWTFINRPVEQFLKLRRAEVLGKHCSTWGAPICKTEKCGVACLKRGLQVTTFQQLGGSFKVDSTYLHDLSGKPVGHIEVVTDRTSAAHLESLVGQVSGTSAQVESASKLLTSQAEAVRGASESVHGTMDEAAQGLNQAAHGTGELAKGSESLALHASQAAALMAQLDQAIASVTSGAQQQKVVVTEAVEVAHGGTDAVSKTIANMEAIERSVAVASESVRELGARQAEIASIVETIGSISDQTNLLALNAAIEAARAGEHGRGFAVVADEVRKLAERAGQATREIGALISTVSAGVEQSTRAMETIRAEVEHGMGSVGDADAALGVIQQRIAAGSHAAGTIQDLVQEIGRSAFGVNDAIAQVAAISEEAASSAEEVNATHEELSASFHEIGQAVGAQVRAAKEVTTLARDLSQMAVELNLLLQDMGGGELDKAA